MAGQPLAGGCPKGTVYQARMRRPSKLDMMTREAIRVLMPPSITNGSLDSTGSTLASMSTLLSATRVCVQNFRISSPVAIPASFRLQAVEHVHQDWQTLNHTTHDAGRGLFEGVQRLPQWSECSKRASRCQQPPRWNSDRFAL